MYDSSAASEGSHPSEQERDMRQYVRKKPFHRKVVASNEMTRVRQNHISKSGSITHELWEFGYQFLSSHPQNVNTTSNP
jgi:hypothetical protein